MDMEYGYGVWIWSMDMEYGYGVWIWSMDMEYGYGGMTRPKKQIEDAHTVLLNKVILSYSECLSISL
jgi:hypothetical protein